MDTRLGPHRHPHRTTISRAIRLAMSDGSTVCVAASACKRKLYGRSRGAADGDGARTPVAGAFSPLGLSRDRSVPADGCRPGRRRPGGHGNCWTLSGTARTQASTSCRSGSRVCPTAVFSISSGGPWTAPGPRTRRVVVNDRPDVALAAGAGGVHLKDDERSAARVRGLGPRDWIVGRSVHDVAAARRAGAARCGRLPVGRHGIPVGVETGPAAARSRWAARYRGRVCRAGSGARRRGGDRWGGDSGDRRGRGGRHPGSFGSGRAGARREQVAARGTGVALRV